MWTVKTLAIFLVLVVSVVSALTRFPIIDTEIPVAEDGSCPPGYFRLNSTICRPCPPGTFMEKYNWAPECPKFSRKCLPTEVLTFKRSSRHDTVCQCKPGTQRTYHNVKFEGNSVTYQYFECTPCPEGTQSKFVRNQLQHGDTLCCPPDYIAIRRDVQFDCDFSQYLYELYARERESKAAQSEKTPPTPPVLHGAGTLESGLTNPDRAEAEHSREAGMVAGKVVAGLAGLLLLALLLCRVAVLYGRKYPESTCGRVYRRLLRQDTVVRYAPVRLE